MEASEYLESVGSIDSLGYDVSMVREVDDDGKNVEFYYFFNYEYDAIIKRQELLEMLSRNDFYFGYTEILLLMEGAYRTETAIYRTSEKEVLIGYAEGESLDNTNAKRWYVIIKATKRTLSTVKKTRGI